jgi:protein-S-isoprenylcysteine O-methyltransferase Ste14
VGPPPVVRRPARDVAGFGLAAGNWLSLAACLVVPLPPLVQRIHVEEAELERVLGDAYRTYEARTARLVPGVW